VGDFSDCCGADIVLIAAGSPSSKLKASRLDDLNESAAIFKSIFPDIAAQNSNAILVIASSSRNTQGMMSTLVEDPTRGRR